MTRREYLENKLAKREEWADKAKARSESRFKRLHQIMDPIPLGQPGLPRSITKAIDSNARAAVEQADLAQHHTQAASGLAHQLDRSIFSDDRHAITDLEERIAAREAEAAKMVATNKAWRKGGAAGLVAAGFASEASAARIARMIEQAYSWEKQPYPAYQLTNLRALIRRDKERIKEIQVREERASKAEAAGGVTVECSSDKVYCSVTFAEKPDRAVLDALRAASFTWSGGSWHGAYAKLPEGIE